MSPESLQSREPLRAIHSKLRWHVLLGFGSVAVALVVSAYVPGLSGAFHYEAVWLSAGLALAAGVLGALRTWDRPGVIWVIGSGVASVVLVGIAAWATGGSESYVLPLGVGLAATAAALLPTRWVVAVSAVCMILIAWPLWEAGSPLLVRQSIVLLPVLPLVAAIIHEIKRITLQESEQRRHLASLVRASRLGTRLDFEVALQSAAEEIKRELNAHHAIVYLVDDERRVLRPRVVCVTPQVLVPGEEDVIRNYTPGVDEGLLGWVFRHAEPVLTGDAQADPRLHRMSTLPARDLSYIVVPLVAADQVLGVIRISRLGRTQFGEDDLQFATVFANQAAVAMQNARLYEEARRLNITDPLTGLYNARSLQERLDREIVRAKRYRRPLSLAMLDSDHLKAVNDRFGHLEGDRYLVRIAECVRGQVRATDMAFRYAGDEFVVLLPETDAEQALPVIERIRRSVEDQSLQVGGEAVPVTISAGVASFPPHDTAEDLLRAADAAMYRAKRQGKNRVEVGMESNN